MSDLAEFPAEAQSLRDNAVAHAADALGASYTDIDRKRFKVSPPDAKLLALRVGAESAAWPAAQWALEILQELIMPGYSCASCDPPKGSADLPSELRQAAGIFYNILLSYFAVELEQPAAQEHAVHTSLALISRFPDFRERASWNIFASLKDPAVWDSFVLREETRRDELGKLDLLDQIDQAIRVGDRNHYVGFLREHGFDYAYNYQRRLVKRSYPGWRALLLHDVAHHLALGGLSARGTLLSRPTPFLPRAISEHAATLYQSDLHPECVIGEANFVEHPHRGITTGQTGQIGRGCVLYPCTLGGVTDKVKARHPRIGDFVLIGTDAGVFGVVEVGDGSIIGANAEIYGLVKLGKNVHMGTAVVARTVRSAIGQTGRLIFEDGVNVGDESLIINDLPCDLVIPARSTIPPHHHVVNDGFGRPKML